MAHRYLLFVVLIGISSMVWMMLEAKALPANNRRALMKSMFGSWSKTVQQVEDNKDQMILPAMIVYYHVVSPYYNNPFHPMLDSSKWSTFAVDSSEEEEEAEESKTIEEITTSETEEEEESTTSSNAKEEDETVTESAITEETETEMITTESPTTDEAAENSTTIESIDILEDMNPQFKPRKTSGRPTSTTYVCILGKCQHSMEAKRKLEQQIEAELWAKL